MTDAAHQGRPKDDRHVDAEGYFLSIVYEFYIYLR